MSIKLIGYLSLGYPTLEKSMQRLEYYLEGGINLIEVDLPTDNAFLDNTFIQNRMKDALSICNDYDFYLTAIQDIYKKIGNRLIVLSYKHTIHQIGIEKFVNAMKNMEYPPLILVGETNDPLDYELMTNGILISSWVPFDLPEDAIQNAKDTNGFVYLQAKSNGSVKKGYNTLKKCVQYLRNQGITRTIYCGVGVSTQEDVKTIHHAQGEGVFIGSALLKKETREEIIEYITSLKV